MQGLLIVSVLRNAFYHTIFYYGKVSMLMFQIYCIHDFSMPTSVFLEWPSWLWNNMKFSHFWNRAEYIYLRFASFHCIIIIIIQLLVKILVRNLHFIELTNSSDVNDKIMILVEEVERENRLEKYFGHANLLFKMSIFWRFVSLATLFMKMEHNNEVTMTNGANYEFSFQTQVRRDFVKM